MHIAKTLQEFFTRPGVWAQGAAAKTAENKAVDASSQKAVSWCLGSAIRLVYKSEREQEIRQKLLELLNEGLDHTLVYESIECWNDDPKRKYKHIRSLICKANV